MNSSSGVNVTRSLLELAGNTDAKKNLRFVARLFRRGPISAKISAKPAAHVAFS